MFVCVGAFMGTTDGSEAEGGDEQLMGEGMDNMCPNANPPGQGVLRDFNQTLEAWIRALERLH